MAATKTFKTTFQLAAKYTGAPAFGSLNRDIDRTQRNAATSTRNIKGMFTAVKVGLAGFGAYAGYKAFRAAFDIGGKAIDAAKGVTKAHDKIRQSYARAAAEQPKRQINIEQETQATIALADAMEKAGGIDAETLGQSLALLSKYYSESDIQKMSRGMQDWLVRVEKGAPTEEAAAQRIEKLNDYIRLGTKEGLRSLDLSKEQIESIKKHEKALGGSSRAEARAAAVAKVLGKETGETARWMKTADGSAYRLAQSQEAWLESAGKSSAKAIPKLNDALADLIDKMQPVADLLDEQMSPHIEDLTKFIDKNKDSFVAWGNNAVWALDYAFEHIERMQNVFWVFDHLIWLGNKLLGIWQGLGSQSIHLPDKLPGSPSDTPISGGAGTQGEAARRAQEGRDKAEKTDLQQRQWGGTGRYYSKPQKVPEVVPQGGSGQFYSGTTGKIPTTSYSQGGRFGPDEMTDRWTEKGYTSTGKNLVRGVVAVNPKVHAIGTVFRDRKTGEAFVAADRHGNVNPRVVDVYEDPKNYKASLGKQRDLAVVGRMPTVPKTPEGVREALSKYGTPPTSQMKLPGGGRLRDMVPRQRTEGISGGQSVAAWSPNVTINGVPTDRQGAVGKEVLTAMRTSTKEFNDQMLHSMKDLNRRTYV